ncbi:U6 snRNA-associated Sm-like protein LSm1 [Echinococcus granulosus]|uniref:U6 snRNA-associated Sm-like protein LSm1 n=1 Tax=Echinococcus granulosus TaxID=6210 RepID=A0A068WKZ4_ECHGR|nr:U6 snRNA-associated Sm-like protein LSm1 [Echinococcus granulosus]CDS19158.1 u6 snRNA associated Sm protein LSm1 [Echinococcus granulosus]
MQSLNDGGQGFLNLPGSASLLNDLGKCLLVKLRGHKCYIGYLRAVDQFGNIVLSEAVERIFVGNKYADVSQGIVLVRGENISLIGELRSDYVVSSSLERVPEEEIFRLQAEFVAERREAHKRRMEILASRGIPWLEQDFMDDM